MKKLKVALIGAGTIGEVHARILYENSAVEFVAVADLRADICGRLAGKYGCRAYEDYTVMLADPQIEAVDICVPEDYHVDVAVAAARAKKHILLEKPIAKTYKEAQQIKEACDNNNVRLMIAHVLKFDPRYVQLKDAQNRGEFGEVSSIALKRIAPIQTPARLKGTVPIFFYMGVHDIEWMLDYAQGAKPVKVYAQGVSKKNVTYNDVDSVFVIVTFDTGALGSLELSWALPENNAVGLLTSVELIGTEGAGMLNISGDELKITSEKAGIYSPDTLHWPIYNGNVMGDLKEEIGHFVHAVLSNQPFVVDTERAMDAVRLIECCFTSIEIGEAVDCR